MRDVVSLGVARHSRWDQFMRTRPTLFATLLALAVSGVFLAPAEAALPTCFGQTVTIMGTDGDDTLTGDAAVRDVIYGGLGNDTIVGGDFYDNGTEPDLLCGGPGNDRVKGARGNDKLNGGDGDDFVDGSNGVDIEQGNAGNDRVGFGSFADADSAADTMRGGPGNDYMVAGFGNDKVYGQGGNDQLYDQECEATLLNGGTGTDYLESFWSSYGGEPCHFIADNIVGGDGVDTAKVDSLDTVSTVENVTRVSSLTPA